MDPNALDFSPKQNTVVAANERIKEVTDYETEIRDVNNISYFQFQIGVECSKGLELSAQELLHDNQCTFRTWNILQNSID